MNPLDRLAEQARDAELGDFTALGGVLAQVFRLVPLGNENRIHIGDHIVYRGIERKDLPKKWVVEDGLPEYFCVADFVADGCTTVGEEQYRERLEICDSCPERRNNRCMKCGCRLSLKARGRAFKCPEDKWQRVENNRND